MFQAGPGSHYNVLSISLTFWEIHNLPPNLMENGLQGVIRLATKTGSRDNTPILEITLYWLHGVLFYFLFLHLFKNLQTSHRGRM